MPRIRSIKPEWLDDEKLCKASDTARLLSVALIVLADDFGNGRSHEMYVASHVWSYGDSKEALRKASRGLQELKKIGFIMCYTVGQQSYYHITNWEKHQKVSHPSKTGIVPAPCDAPDELAKDSGNSRETYLPDQEIKKEIEIEKDRGSISVRSKEVWSYWQSKAENGGGYKYTQDREGKIKARLNEGYTVGELCAAIDGCFANSWYVEKGVTDAKQIFKDAATVDKHRNYKANKCNGDDPILDNSHYAKPDGASELYK